MSERVESNRARNHRIEFYKTTESKITIVQDLWKRLQQLPPASSHPTEDRKAMDQQALAGGVELAITLLPHAKQSLERKKYLLQNAQQLTNRESRELRALHKNADVTFLEQVEEGVDRIVAKRQQIREFLETHTKSGASIALFKQLAASDLPDDWKKLAEHVVDMLPGRFSVGFFIDEEAYKQFFSDSAGMHYPFTIWDIVADNTSESVETFIHEDIHSLLEEFTPQTLSSHQLRLAIKTLPTMINKILQEQRRGKFAEQGRRALRLTLERIVNGKYDEFLAEQASELTVIPTGSFAHEMAVKRRIIEDVFFKMGLTFDPKIDHLVQNIDAQLDYKKHLKEIMQSYELLREKREDKIRDLFFAFILFPPTQWKYIHELANFWANELKTPPNLVENG